MKLESGWTRGILIVLGVAVLAASFASPAAADHGRRFKGDGGRRGDWAPRIVQRVYCASPVRSYAYISSRGSGAPALAGFIGGLVIGNALAHAAPPVHAYCPPPLPDYYYDPYCHESFTSLDAYGNHLECARHPAWVKVIDGNSGQCVGEVYWQDGRWREREDFRARGGDDDDPGGDWNR